MSKSILVVALSILVVAAVGASAPGIAGIVSSLKDFQTFSGGFAPSEGASPTLIATENALFLSTLFGARDQVNAANVATFLQSVATSDHGYSNTAGGAADVVAVRNALLSYAHIGQQVPNPSGVVAFLVSCFDKEGALFANVPGGSGNLKATAHAVQALEQLNALADKTAILAAIHGSLNEIVQTSDGVKFFSPLTENNYYGLVAAVATGYDLGSGNEFARYVQSLQTPRGGFGPDADPTDSLRPIDSAYAVLSLHLLEKATKSSAFIDGIDADNLVAYITRLPRDLASASAGAKALARTRQLSSLFNTKVVFDVEDARFPVTDDRIISGSSVKPMFSIRSPSGGAHAHLDVTATIKPQSAKPTTLKLSWNADAQRYTAASAFAAEELGRINFEFSVRLNVADLGGDVVMNFAESRRVGYDITVDGVATYDGREVARGGQVGPGAVFAFTLGLGTVSKPKPTLLSGDFDVVFSVKDSALTTIHEEKISAKDNNKPFFFTYTLANAGIPAGPLHFQFGAGSHTTERVSYSLPVQMVAASVKFSATSYKLGETVEVRMNPATLVGKALKFYSGVDAKGKSVSRRFFMDLYSPATKEVVDVVSGVADVEDDADRQVYTFSYTLSPSFTAVAALGVRFRYVTAEGEIVPLAAYNTQTGDLYHPAEVLSYKVNADLRVTNVVNDNFPAEGKINYGNSIRFSFKVHDAVSKQDIAGRPGSTAAAVLRHQDGSQWFTSARQAATFDQESGQFSIDFLVNPNAQNGATTMKLVGQGPDEAEIPLRTDDGKEWSVEFVVGGKIDVEKKVFSHTVTDPRTAEEYSVFLVSFDLSSGGESLYGADLVAIVTFPNGASIRTSATQAQDEDLDSTGYQVSWVLGGLDAPSGTYTVDLFREVDLKRSGAAKPFISVDVPYQASSKSSLPVKSEFIVLIILGAIFFSLSFRKMELEGSRSAKK